MGLANTEMPREGVFCSQTILSDQGVLVPTVLADSMNIDRANEGQVGVQFFPGTPEQRGMYLIAELFA